MQLKMQTYGAIRLLLYLTLNKGFTATKDIAAATGISEFVLPRIAKKLRDAKWITSSVGNTGGYCLVANSADISLWNVMQIMENTVPIHGCAEEISCDCQNIPLTSPAYEIYAGYDEITEWYFSAVKISDLLEADGFECIYRKTVEAVQKNIDKKILMFETVR